MSDDIVRDTRMALARIALRTAAETLAIVADISRWRWTCFCATWLVIGNAKMAHEIDGSRIEYAVSTYWTWSDASRFEPREINLDEN